MATSPDNGLRVTQRATTRCTNCAERRIKCSREVLPCESCIKGKRADTCRRETVIVRGRAVTGSEYSSGIPVASGSRSPQNRAGMVDSATQTLPLPQSSSLPSSHESNRIYAQQHLSSLNHDDETIFDADLSAIGLRNKRKDEANDTEERGWKRQRLEPAPSLSDTTSRLVSLVPLSLSTALVETSLKFLSVLHTAVHVPTYLDEHAKFLAGIVLGEADPRPECLALYFAIISSGAYFMPGDLHREIGLSEEDAATLPAIWHKAALDALQTSDFMAHHTIESIQAICVMTLAAHAFGPSSRIFTLQACAIHMAQSLQLHLLAAEGNEAKPGLIHREVGRRLWMFLLNQQRLSPFAQQPGAIFTPRGRCALPANCEDEDIQDAGPLMSRSLHVPTLTTNNYGKAVIADIMADFFSAFYDSSTLKEQQQAVAVADEKLLHIFDGLPTLRPSSAPYPTAFDLNAPSHLVAASIRWTWEQHLWAIIVPMRRILVHRAFLSRSFREAQFEPSRVICAESARAILAERRRPIPAIFDRLWHISADVISAGAILAIIARYSQGGERLRLRGEVQECIDILSRKSVQHGITERGIKLLKEVLAESDEEPPTPPYIPDMGQTAYLDQFQLFGEPFQGEEAWDESFGFAFPIPMGFAPGFWSGIDKSEYDPAHPTMLPF